jgi:hypothetical protein
METSLHTINKTAQPTGFFEVPLHKTNLAATIGSADWVKENGIFANFDAKEFTLFDDSVMNCRCAEIQVNTKTRIIAVENLTTVEVIRSWETCPGIHRIAIDWEERFEQGMPFNVSLTPTARQIVEDIAEKVRDEFAAWVQSDKQTETLEVKLTPCIFRRYCQTR